MDFSKIRVLVTNGSGRQTLTIVRGLKAVGCKVAVLCTEKHDLCCASRFPDEKIVDERSANVHPEFVDFVLDLVKTGKYDVLLPVAEVATDRITERETEFLPYTRLACAPRAAYAQAGDKQKTYDAAMRLGIPCAKTRTDDETVDEFLARAEFPLIVKPRHGMGSMGFHKYDTEAAFRAAMEAKVFIPDEYIIQEFVDHEKRHGTYIMVDQHGDVKSALASEVVRWYPIDAGTSTLSVSIDDPDVLRYAGMILKEFGWRGYANVGFMMDKKDGQPKLLEINGRIPAPIKLTWICGFNVARQLVEMACGEEVTDYGMNKKFGMGARHFQADLMWFLKSPDRFRAKPNWFSWKNQTDLVLWWDDVKPFIVYTLSAFGQYKHFKELRKR